MFLIHTFPDSICYERGYINQGHPLKVFWDSSERKYVNYKRDVYSAEGCITLCKYYDQCQWWNYDPVQQACWLKEGAGNPKRESRYSSMFTGHRDSTELCQNRHLITPEVWNRNNNNGGDDNYFTYNPCPAGRINENCYDDGTCIRCCTGGVDGRDNTPACIH